MLLRTLRYLHTPFGTLIHLFLSFRSRTRFHSSCRSFNRLSLLSRTLRWGLFSIDDSWIIHSELSGTFFFHLFLETSSSFIYSSCMSFSSPSRFPFPFIALSHLLSQVMAFKCPSSSFKTLKCVPPLLRYHIYPFPPLVFPGHRSHSFRVPRHRPPLLRVVIRFLLNLSLLYENFFLYLRL